MHEVALLPGSDPNIFEKTLLLKKNQNFIYKIPDIEIVICKRKFLITRKLG